MRYVFEEEHVVRKTRNFLKGSTTVYENKMTSKCLIIQNSKPEDKDSMNADAKNLTRLFSNLNYDVKVIENLTAEQIEENLKNFGSQKGHGDSVVVCFIAHGNVHGICGIDKKVFNPERVYHLLGPENAPELAGKPKIVISESCRGRCQDGGYTMVQETREPDRTGWFLNDGECTNRSGRVAEKGAEKATTIPTNSDFYLSFATTAGNLAYAHKVLGSFHFRALCHTFAQRAHREDIAKLMVEVGKKLGQIDFRLKDGVAKQMPETRSTLTRNFFFNTVKKSEQAQLKERRQNLL
ncbi:unnamed protein product [Caenorhabditis nigoni]